MADNESDGGFTLIELLIVVVVMGVLASIVVFALSAQQAQAVRAACLADTRTVVEAQAASQTITGTYSNDVVGLVPKYLRSPPLSHHYVITTDTSGTVYVAPASGGSPAPVNVQPNPCSSIS